MDLEHYRKERSLWEDPRNEKGASGERWVNGSLSRVGFRCHKPEIDRDGWDLLVEYTDHKEYPYKVTKKTYYIQVKTWAKPPCVALKIMCRLIAESRPVFFVILTRDKPIYWHLDLDTCGKMLEKAMHEPGGSVSIPYIKEGRLFDPETFKHEADSLVGCIETYGRKKRDINENAGYGEKSHHLELYGLNAA